MKRKDEILKKIAEELGVDPDSLDIECSYRVDLVFNPQFFWTFNEFADAMLFHEHHESMLLPPTPHLSLVLKSSHYGPSVFNMPKLYCN